MPLFGKKKTADEDYSDESSIEEIKNIIEEHRDKPDWHERPQSKRSEEDETRGTESPMGAPLFVKIDRYRGILSAIGYLKTALVMVKNSFITLRELEKAREQTMELIVNALEKMDDKLANLDTDLVRPTGFRETPKGQEEYQDMETVHASIADLKGQIDQLKSELEAMS